MARCFHRAEPFLQLSYLVTFGSLSDDVVGIASVAAVACWYQLRTTCGGLVDSRSEKDPQHRAPQLSRQAPNQL